MTTTNIVLSVIIALLIALFLGYIFWLQRKESEQETDSVKTSGNSSLQLQAYERLTLLADRIAIPNLIARLNEPGISARDMQIILTQNIKQEFDYNITQQIYVSTNAWNAVKNLKEQNMLTVNQLAAVLPANATGLDLNKMLLDYSMNNQRGNLHEMVSEALSYEAKKLL